MSTFAEAVEAAARAGVERTEVPTRTLTRPPPTRAVNLRREPYDVYIGRAGQGQDGYFGNPFRVVNWHSEAHLKRVMEDFRRYFAARLENDPEFRARVLQLRGKRLGCFCKPGPCHGDVIAEWVEGQEARHG